nr:uncharacterized protein LOC109192340 isoform X2 [Ipomoea batatas]
MDGRGIISCCIGDDDNEDNVGMNFWLGEDVISTRSQANQNAKTCNVKCVNTCIRGGYGSPREGSLNVRKPLVVFKDGFRSRHYCLVEHFDICNLIRDGEDGP